MGFDGYFSTIYITIVYFCWRPQGKIYLKYFEVLTRNLLLNWCRHSFWVAHWFALIENMHGTYDSLLIPSWFPLVPCFLPLSRWFCHSFLPFHETNIILPTNCLPSHSSHFGAGGGAGTWWFASLSEVRIRWVNKLVLVDWTWTTWRIILYDILWFKIDNYMIDML